VDGGNGSPACTKPSEGHSRIDSLAAGGLGLPLSNQAKLLVGHVYGLARPLYPHHHGFTLFEVFGVVEDDGALDDLSGV
jgi:hypothetical protein